MDRSRIFVRIEIRSMAIARRNESKAREGVMSHEKTRGSEMTIHRRWFECLDSVFAISATCPSYGATGPNFTRKNVTSNVTIRTIAIDQYRELGICICMHAAHMYTRVRVLCFANNYK